MKFLFMLCCLPVMHCQHQILQPSFSPHEAQDEKKLTSKKFPDSSWQNFLQHLPSEKKPVVDYTGKEVRDQYKQFAVLSFDVGKQDLQQCADALIRLRAEYLWQQGRKEHIAFHFTDGRLYRFADFCRGVRPQLKASKIRMIQTSKCEPTKIALRKYLDLVYSYAGTISLEHELKSQTVLSVGTVIIKGGTPGHCMIIVDEALDSRGESYYRLVEGYTPAQSIYILQNPANAQPDPWFRLEKGKTIETHSYRFEQYRLKSFE